MKWIKVTDKLPEFKQEVIVYGTKRLMSPQMGGNPPRVMQNRRIDLRGTSLEKNRLRNVCENDFQFMEKVTHWMPLPENPK